MSIERYRNRELSWLDFNSRVLALAEDPNLPLLERARFLSIWANNLDEFFMVRVAGLKELQIRGLPGNSPDGMSPGEQLELIRAEASDQYRRAHATFADHVSPQLVEAGIELTDYQSLSPEDRGYVDDMFRNRVFPVLTPLAVDPAHPFPYISNLSLNLAVLVRNPDTDLTRFARVKVPPILPRFVLLPDGHRYVPLEQVIAAHLGMLFPGMQVVERHAFRVTRNADIEIEEEEGDDLLATIESELTRRGFGSVVRLEVNPSITDEVLDLLMREMLLGTDEVQRVEGPLDLDGLRVLPEIDRPELLHDRWAAVTQPRLATTAEGPANIFASIAEGDLLVHHPYDSFGSSVATFLDQAARDPKVLAIKQTLYRTSANSPIIQSLMYAAKAGKQVVVLVELMARFDEERNIEFAQKLEDAGVHVVYGVIGLKTHTKIALVVRDDGDAGIRRYAHVGTGNYNDATARIYEDLGLFTADPEIGADLSDLFNFLTGYSQQTTYRKLLVSPNSFRPRLTQMIRDEAQRGEAGHITMKMNSLVDERMIEELYEASKQGCRVDLIIRGICSLIPGAPGMSENINVRSVVGRYLEHSRVFRFGARGADRKYFLGSADLMPRNLDRRVEAVVPIEDPDLRFRIDELLEVSLADDTLAWVLGSDSIWSKIPADIGVETHLTLRTLAEARASSRLDT